MSQFADKLVGLQAGLTLTGLNSHIGLKFWIEEEDEYLCSENEECQSAVQLHAAGIC